MKCLVKDGMLELYPKIEQAEVLVISTPIYWFGPSAQTKLFLDRLRPYFANKKLAGKKAAIILPAGTGDTDCDLTIEMFKRSFDALEIEMIGSVTSKSFDKGEAANDKKAVEGIKVLAEKITLYR